MTAESVSVTHLAEAASRAPQPRLSDPLSDAMERYACGDDAAFGPIFGELAPRLRAFLQRMSGRRDVADDLTQEAFLRIHRARGSFAPGRAVLPWAYAIARNCYLDHVRAKSRAKLASNDDAIQSLAAGPDASAEEEMVGKQSAALVERTLAAMTPARREAFVLLRYEGLSVEAAAQVLGVSESAVKVRAFHAYELLRAALKSGR
ncbi:MAG TPA: RNA polymerase sigma factor [Polyangiaceae bacterium]|nr:RNA polymerase sigma factor [Polyangiaceae bacterium]